MLPLLLLSRRWPRLGHVKVGWSRLLLLLLHAASPERWESEVCAGRDSLLDLLDRELWPILVVLLDGVPVRVAGHVPAKVPRISDAEDAEPAHVAEAESDEPDDVDPHGVDAALGEASGAFGDERPRAEVFARVGVHSLAATLAARRLGALLRAGHEAVALAAGQGAALVVVEAVAQRSRVMRRRPARASRRRRRVGRRRRRRIRPRLQVTSCPLACLFCTAEELC
mmetsp:Transcript_19580/g.66060  ORF Transcript_19580/g.66060 Transcript_19580/m.66060 type:complete len:226 (-) Transcript_19580:483-1160(-)